MTVAEEILSQVSGANEARNAAMQFGPTSMWANGVEVIRFYQDNSVLMIFGNLAVIAGKGQ